MEGPMILIDRPGTQRRRVSHLVGRFEQLGSQSDRPTSETDSRPSSKQSNTSPPRQTYSSSAKRSVSASDFSWEARLADETSRLSEILTQCEALRRKCREDGESLDLLKRKLEHEELARQDSEARFKLMEEELKCVQHQLSVRDEEEKTRSKRAAAVVEELQEQWARSEEAQQTACKVSETKVQQQHELPASEVQVAEGRKGGSTGMAKSFEKHMLELKHSMAASTRTVSQVTDQQIGEKMTMLNHSLQNWVVHVFRKVEIVDHREMEERLERSLVVSQSSILRYLYLDFDSGSKLFALQGIVAYLLMSIFEDEYYALPEDLHCLRDATSHLKAANPSYNEWRSQTFAFVYGAEEDLKSKIDAATEKQKAQLMRGIANVLFSLTKVELDDSQQTGLDRIVSNAIALSRILKLQRAVYECVFPAMDDAGCLHFDRHLMEDVHNEEETSDTLVRCVTFPALIKTGDEHGDNMSLRNVVTRAKVFCHCPDDHAEGDLNDDEDEDDDDDFVTVSL